MFPAFLVFLENARFHGNIDAAFRNETSRRHKKPPAEAGGIFNELTPKLRNHQRLADLDAGRA